jgi:SWI/SNF-related matrix-associated actin-dependent regulator 1 of chromatin subfamily A
MATHNISVIREADRWVAKFPFSYETKDFVKGAGFRFDGQRKLWWTADPAIASKLDPKIAASIAIQTNTAIAASRATDAPAGFMAPSPQGLIYRPFQLAGIAFALSRANCLIGDEMGLGKTLQAIGVINSDTSIRRVLCIVKASIKINWQRELTKWLTRDLSVGIANGGSLPTTDVVVINYDILKKHIDSIRAVQWDLLVVDECHLVKNPKAQRTVLVLGRWDRDPAKVVPAIPAKRRIFMTGTPIVNKPIELFPLLKALDPFGLGKSRMEYAKRYCNAHINSYGYWDYDGASNLDELQRRLRSSIMIRRLKADVLKELPPKQHQVIVMPTTDPALLALLRDELRTYDDTQDANLKTRSTAFERIAKLRHDVAVAKIPMCIEFVRDALDESDKIVVFAHHHDVVDALMDAFADIDAVKLTGETPMVARQEAIDRFQNDPACRLFVGNIQAAGAGITLTAAQHCIFVESDWAPGNMDQASDRLHRITQEGSVLVQYLILDDSLDAKMAVTISDKANTIRQALDTGNVEVEVPVIVPHTPQAPVASPDDLTQQQVEAVHQGLRMLAAMCDGAAALDGCGFNKLDTQTGHSLANWSGPLTPKQAKLGLKLVIKYQRQLPASLLATARGI